VPVEEEQPVTAASPERQEIAEQDRAVAAEHDRELARLHDGADSVGERDGVTSDAPRVE
jgi:hypothetical protein